MVNLSRLNLYWKNPLKEDCEYENFLLVAGAGISFDYTNAFCTNTCNEIVNIPTVTISSLSYTWTRFELEIDSTQAQLLNTTGLSLLSVVWSYIVNSSGGNTGSWTVADVPLMIALNGQILSSTEYEVTAGTLRFKPPTEVYVGDHLSVWKLG